MITAGNEQKIIQLKLTLKQIIQDAAELKHFLNKIFAIFLLYLYSKPKKMSSLYPTLEDMQVDKMIQAQNYAAAQSQATQAAAPAYTQNPYPELNNGNNNSALVMYPNLGEFMGLDLSEDMIRSNMPEYLSDALQPVSAQLQ